MVLGVEEQVEEERLNENEAHLGQQKVTNRNRNVLYHSITHIEVLYHSLPIETSCITQ